MKIKMKEGAKETDMKINCLTWQRDELMVMYRKEILFSSSVLKDKRHLEAEIKKNNNCEIYLKEVQKDRDRVQEELDRLRMIKEEEKEKGTTKVPIIPRSFSFSLSVEDGKVIYFDIDRV